MQIYHYVRHIEVLQLALLLSDLLLCLNEHFFGLLIIILVCEHDNDKDDACNKMHVNRFIIEVRVKCETHVVIQ